MIERNLENEGRILTVKNDISGDCLQLYWNGDTPKHSKEVARNEEIFLYVTSVRGDRHLHSSTTFSATEAIALRDVLDFMINKLEE